MAKWLPSRGQGENLVCRVLHLANPEESGRALVVPPIVLLLGKVEGYERMLTRRLVKNRAELALKLGTTRARWS